MTDKSVWEQFFDQHAPIYDENDFTSNTLREIDFLLEELSLLTVLLRLAGMQALSVWGGTAGNWGRRLLDMDEIEMMIVAEKTADPMPGVSEPWPAVRK